VAAGGRALGMVAVFGALAKRPLVCAALALAAGSYAGALVLHDHAALPVFLGLVGVSVALLMPRRPVMRVVATALTFASVGAILWNLRHAEPFGDPLCSYAVDHPDEVIDVEGRVRSTQIILPGAEYARFIVDVDRVMADEVALPLRGGVQVRWTGSAAPLFADDRVRVRGELTAALGRANFGIDDVEDYLRRNHVHSAMTVRGSGNVVRLGSGRWWRPGHWASRLRAAEAERLRKVIPERAWPFVLAVWLGERTEIGEAEYRSFVETGTAHVLAVSGVHTAIIYASVWSGLSVLIRRRSVRAAVTMGAVLLFALVAGAHVSSLRAAAMIALYVLADLFDREPDAPTALSVAAILLTLANPDNLLDRGFLLSFTSVASILLFTRPLGEVFRAIPVGLRSGLVTPLAVQILPWPLAAHFFHVLPWAAPLANLVVVPLLTVVLWLSFMTTVGAFLWSGLGLVFGHAVAPAVWAIHAVVDAVARAPRSHHFVVSPTALAMAAFWAASFAGLRAVEPDVLRRRWQAAVLAILLAVLAYGTWRPMAAEPEVAFLDVGQGDACFIRTPAGRTLLIDAGDSTEHVDMGARVVAPFLWAHHVDQLDCLILTHPDTDHIGGMPYIVDHFSVGELILGPRDTGNAAEARLIASCARREIPVRRVAAGGRLEIEGCRVEVLHPPIDWPATSTLNDTSLVIRIAWPGFDGLFTGDIEAAAETSMIPRLTPTRVLKAPHHGSRTSSTREFLDAVRPEVVVVSTGGDVRKGGDPAVLKRYEDLGATVYRTDVAGGISVTSDDHGRLVFRAARAEKANPIGR